MNRFLQMLCVAMCVAVPSFAQDAASASGATTNIHTSRKFGIGLGGGSLASGITGKYFLSNEFAVQAAVGTYVFTGFGLGVDGLYLGKQLWTNGDLGLNWEAGAGVSTLAFTSVPGTMPIIFGVDGIIGLSLQYRNIPLELTTAFRPGFFLGNYNLYSGLVWGYGGALRYYF